MTKRWTVQQCKAHNRQGQQCGYRALPGLAVCRMHGGASPVAQAAAKMRLAALVDPSIGVLDKTLKNGKRPDLQFKAACDVLDRNNLSGVQKHEDVTPAERMTPEERLERLRAIHEQLVATKLVQ